MTWRPFVMACTGAALLTAGGTPGAAGTPTPTPAPPRGDLRGPVIIPRLTPFPDLPPNTIDQQHPIVIVRKDPGLYPMVVARGKTVEYPIRIIPPAETPRSEIRPPGGLRMPFGIPRFR
jgi:hypothetical protein